MFSEKHDSSERPCVLYILIQKSGSYVDQTGFTLSVEGEWPWTSNPPSTTLWMLQLWAYATTPSFMLETESKASWMWPSTLPTELHAPSSGKCSPDGEENAFWRWGAGWGEVQFKTLPDLRFHTFNNAQQKQIWQCRDTHTYSAWLRVAESMCAH